MSANLTTLLSSTKGTLMELPSKAWKIAEERLAKVDVFDETKTDLQKESPWYQLGSFVYLFWIITVSTGLLLTAVYIPTTSQAYDTIIAIKENPLFGLIRGMHKYGGDAIIIAATLRMYRMWFCAEYKNKGELSFIIALVSLLLGMYSGLSGYLLIWNQRAFWATKVFATFPTFLDIKPAEMYWFVPYFTGMATQTIGDLTHQGMNVSQILLGGSSIGQATMTRFYSLHFALSLLALIASELYFYQNRKTRINMNRWQVLILIAMLAFVAVVLPGEMGSRANPEVTPLPILSDWYFLALYQMLKYMDPYWATVWTVGLPVSVIGLALLDWGPERNPWKRPFFTVAMIAAFIDFVLFSGLIIANQANINRDPPYWYAQMIVMLTVGMIWHYALYKDIKSWLIWTLPNMALSAWYIFFYCIPKPALPAALSFIYTNDPKRTPTPDIMANLQAHPFIVLWFVFSLLLMGLTVIFLGNWMKARKTQQQAGS